MLQYKLREIKLLVIAIFRLRLFLQCLKSGISSRSRKIILFKSQHSFIQNNEGGKWMANLISCQPLKATVGEIKKEQDRADPVLMTR